MNFCTFEIALFSNFRALWTVPISLITTYNFSNYIFRYGLFLSASSVFKDWQFLSVLSPMFVHFLITKISGIPLLEKAGMKKWGHLAEYQNYLRNTPSLVPFLK